MSFAQDCKDYINYFLTQDDSSICFLSLQDSLGREVFSDLDVPVINLENRFSPLAPFLQILAREKPSEEIIDELVSFSHRETFSTYFNTGLAEERHDIVVEDTISFEQNIFIKEVMALLERCCAGKYIITNAQFLSPEAFSTLKAVEDISMKGRIVFCFNPDKLESESGIALDVYEFAKSRKSFIHFYNIFTNADPQRFMKDVVPYVPEFSEIYRCLKNCRQFLLVSQASNIVKSISSHLEEFCFTQKQKRLMTFEIALADFYSSKLDDATLMLNKVITDDNDDELNLIAMFYLSKVYFQKKMNPVAFKYALSVEQSLRNKKLTDNHYYALTVMQGYNSVTRANHGYLEKRYFDALSLLEKKGLWNNYIEIALNVPSFLIESNNDEITNRIIPIIENCKNVAERIGNTLGLSTAYQWFGILYSRMGKTDTAIESYNRSLELRSRLKDIVYIIRIKNGLSFESLMKAEYKNAYELLNCSVSRLDEITNYRTIINTMRNIALPLFYSHNFEKALKVLQLLTNIIKIFDLDNSANNSFLPEFNDMIIYRTYIEYKTGSVDRAKIQLYNLLNSKRNISDELYLLLYLLQAIMLVDQGRIDEAVEVMNESIPEEEDISKLQGHIVCFALYEFAVALKYAGYAEKAQEFVNHGFKIAKDRNFLYYTKSKDSLTVDEYEAGYEEFEPLQLSIDSIREKINRERLVNQFHKKIEDYRFLNRLMTEGSELKNLKLYFKQSIQLLYDYSIAEAIYIAEKEDGRWKNIAGVYREVEKKPSGKEWSEYQKISDRYFNNSLIFDSEKNRYFCVSENFGFAMGIVICYSEERRLTSENQNILNIAIADIQAKYIIIKQSECLVEVSELDQLSHLYNRRALIDYIDEQSLKIKRYSLLDGSYDLMTFAFIDLDNFKYYNDTFGHKAGDLLIKAFAEILAKEFRKVDFVCRYGGDEFVVVVYGATCKEAYKRLEALAERLKENEWFVPRLEALLEKKLDIPEKYHLGFSAGLCSNSDLEYHHELHSAIECADKALYYSKKHRKGTYTVYNDIKSIDY